MNKNYSRAYDPEDYMPIVDKAVDVTWKKANGTSSSPIMQQTSLQQLKNFVAIISAIINMDIHNQMNVTKGYSNSVCNSEENTLSLNVSFVVVCSGVLK